MPTHDQSEPSAESLVTPELYEDAKHLLNLVPREWNVQRLLRAMVGVEAMVEAALKQTRNGRSKRPVPRDAEAEHMRSAAKALRTGDNVDEGVADIMDDLAQTPLAIRRLLDRNRAAIGRATELQMAMDEAASLAAHPRDAHTLRTFGTLVHEAVRTAAKSARPAPVGDATRRRYRDMARTAMQRLDIPGKEN